MSRTSYIFSMLTWIDLGWVFFIFFFIVIFFSIYLMSFFILVIKIAKLIKPNQVNQS
jgi:hypothetical protein